MAWEERQGKQGQRYYYRKGRIGRRVISEYVGAGAEASRIASLDALDRQNKASAALARRDHSQHEQDLSTAMGETEAVLQALTKATLIVSGYRSHKGQWRKRREAKHE